MKIFSKLLIGKFVNLIKDTVSYIKDRYYIKSTLYSKELKYVLDQYLHTNIKKDWIGRLYGIINPAIDSSGEFNISNMIIELDGDNTNNHEHIRQWTYKQMKLIAHLFKIEKLYDYINIEFEHVGPENADNYLIIFDMVSRKQFAQSIKKFLKHLSIYVGLGLTILFIYLKIY